MRRDLFGLSVLWVFKWIKTVNETLNGKTRVPQMRLNWSKGLLMQNFRSNEIIDSSKWTCRTETWMCHSNELNFKSHSLFNYCLMKHSVWSITLIDKIHSETERQVFPGINWKTSAETSQKVTAPFATLKWLSGHSLLLPSFLLVSRED